VGLSLRWREWYIARFELVLFPSYEMSLLVINRILVIALSLLS